MSRGGRNQGTSYETELERAFGTYLLNGIAKVEKCDAPTKVLGKKVIYLENPFPDFIGTWTQQGGRLLTFEAKRTDAPTLGVGKSGLKTHQLDALDLWHRAGGFSALLWQYRGETRAMTAGQIRKALSETGRKSLMWEQATPLPRGTGWVSYDFLKWAKELTTARGES